MQKLISKIKKAILARIKEYNVRKHVISEIKSNPTPEKNEVLQYLKHFKRFSYDLYFPYSWGKEYNYKAVKLLHDEDGYPYVFHRGHKLFFQKKWSDTYCKKYYNWLLLEQDHRSPHVYIKDVDRLPSSNDVVADIGAAEGIFALNVFSSITPPPEVYLFECDPEWKEPLRRTFMPWKDSVIFINKYIGNKETSDTTTIDAFFKDKKIDYIKADVEGMEEQLLIGARNTMLNKCKRILICLYHLANAEETVINYLNEYGFDHITNPSYMIYYAYDNMPPFLRRGVCFGYKV